MLLDLNQPLGEGQSFSLTLNFEKDGADAITVTIEAQGWHNDEVADASNFFTPILVNPSSSSISSRGRWHQTDSIR